MGLSCGGPRGACGRRSRRQADNFSAADCPIAAFGSPSSTHHFSQCVASPGTGAGRILPPPHAFGRTVFPQKQNAHMTPDQDRWQRLKDRLRYELGEDVYNSWFGRMEFEGIEKDVVRHSVPTRFLRKWIQSHYADRVLALWQGEEPTVNSLVLTARSNAMRTAPLKA